MINQLRIYEIFGNTRTEFLDRFRDHASRIMARHGVQILSMWTTTQNGNPAFAYLLAWQDVGAQQAGWAAFMADTEWQAVKAARGPDASPIVGQITDLSLDPVAFSQALS